VLSVAARAGVSRPAVWRWRQPFAEKGVAGLLRDKTRPPGTPATPAETVTRVVTLTCSEPPHEATHWTGRAMAKATGLSLSTLQPIWAVHQLQPHRLPCRSRLTRCTVNYETILSSSGRRPEVHG
jgi:hypothetical protein